MTAEQASNLLQNTYIETGHSMVWADLGAGSGTFTLALAGLLPPGSTIYAIDTNKAALKAIPAFHNQVKLETYAMDFTREELPLSKLDGFLMANALHYVSDQVAFLEKMNKYLAELSYFLTVEYDTDQSIPTWVPYPVSYHTLANLVKRTGYQTIHKLGEQASIYGRAKLYSALAVRGRAH